MQLPGRKGTGIIHADPHTPPYGAGKGGRCRIRNQAPVPCKIAEIFIIQKGTAAVVLVKTLFLPVDRIAQALSNLTLLISIPLQGILVDHDLPAGTAGIRADTGGANNQGLKNGY